MRRMTLFEKIYGEKVEEIEKDFDKCISGIGT